MSILTGQVLFFFSGHVTSVIPRTRKRFPKFVRNSSHRKRISRVLFCFKRYAKRTAIQVRQWPCAWSALSDRAVIPGECIQIYLLKPPCNICQIRTSPVVSRPLPARSIQGLLTISLHSVHLGRFVWRFLHSPVIREGHVSDPYEQNTQHSPGLGRRIALHESHSWQAPSGMVSALACPHFGHVKIESLPDRERIMMAPGRQVRARNALIALSIQARHRRKRPGERQSAFVDSFSNRCRRRLSERVTSYSRFRTEG
jgi:hypothetical protein